MKTSPDVTFLYSPWTQHFIQFQEAAKNFIIENDKATNPSYLSFLHFYPIHGTRQENHTYSHLETTLHV